MNMLKLFTWLLVDQFKLSFGGGGGGGPQTTTTNTANIPEYAKPYVENMLGSAQTQIYSDDMKTFRPYQAFSPDPNDYMASYSPLQQSAQQSAYNLQTPQQFGTASNLTGAAAAGSLGAANQAGVLQNQALGYGGAGAQYGNAGAEYGAFGSQQANQAAQQTAGQAGMYGAQGANAGQQAAGLSSLYGGLGAQAGQGYADLSTGVGQQGSNIGQQYAGQSAGYGGLGALSGQQYANQSTGYGGLGAGYGAQGSQIGQSLGQQATNPNAVQAYMNPYLQASLNPQLEAIQRQYDITGTQQQSGATKSNAFGGNREALMAAENQRSKNSAMNTVIGQGYNTAFQNAQQQLQAANQAALAGNAQALQGSAQGLQGAGQAGSQSLAGYGMGLQGVNQAGQLGLQGNQQALAGYGQAGQQAMQGYGMGLQGAGQAGTQAMQGAQTGLQGVGAQQAAANLGLAGTAQGMQGAGLGMQGAQSGMQGVQGAIGAGQYGLAGLGQAGQMGNQLANIGQQELAAQQGIINTQNQMGAGMQAQEQQKINQQIQDYATAQQYPFMQLGIMNSLLRGLPMQNTTTQSYQAQPALGQQALGLGLGALGASKAFA